MALLQWIAPDAAGGLRVDQCIRRYMPEIDAIALRQAFGRRDVKVNGQRVKQDHRISPGDQVQVYYVTSAQTHLSLDVVYEDRDVLLLNKRAGISVDADDGPGITLTHMAQRYVQANGEDGSVVTPCYWLDNQTCGLILFARHEGAAAILYDAFRSRTVEKHYTCLVRGQPKPPAATCKAFLRKDARFARVSVMDAPSPGAKPIITAYETITPGDVSRLRVHLITGRTHQIRAHMAALGHPLLGDDLYGDRRFNRLHKVRRLCLCATSLTLHTGGRLPQLDGKTFRIDCPF